MIQCSNYGLFPVEIDNSDAGSELSGPELAGKDTLLSVVEQKGGGAKMRQNPPIRHLAEF